MNTLTTNWLSVTDALPNIGMPCLVVRHGCVWKACKADADLWYIPVILRYFRNDEIDRWMPFPSKESMVSVEESLPDARYGTCAVRTADNKCALLDYQYQYDKEGNILGISWFRCSELWGTKPVHDVTHWASISA